MIDIKINITNKIANAIGTPFIVCGNSDYTVTFTFDAEWGAYQEKTARFFFVSDGIEQYIDVLFSGNTCNAPVLPNIEKVLIGVYTGNLRTTTGAEVRCKRSILFGGKVHEPPTTEDVYNEILEIVSKKLGSEGGTVTGDYFKDGNTFIHEGNLELVEPKINEVLANEKLVETASGSAITVDSSQAPLQNLKLYGKTTQDGTPTPTEPKELKSVGDSGSFTVEIQGENVAKQALTMPYTLRSDKSGVTDEIDLTRGVHIQNVKFGDFKDLTWTRNSGLTTGAGSCFYAVDWSLKKISQYPVISTHFAYNQLPAWEDLSVGQMFIQDNHIVVATEHTTLADFKQWLTDNEPKFIYPLATPIETPLTETELNAYRQLYTNKGTTTILNSDGADMEISYYIDKPNAQAIGNLHTQINKDYFKLQQAIISLGGTE